MDWSQEKILISRPAIHGPRGLDGRGIQRPDRLNPVARAIAKAVAKK